MAKALKVAIQRIEKLIEQAGFGKVRYEHFRNVEVDNNKVVMVSSLEAGAAASPYGGNCGVWVGEIEDGTHVSSTITIPRFVGKVWDFKKEGYVPQGNVYIKDVARLQAILKLSKKLNIDFKSARAAEKTQRMLEKNRAIASKAAKQLTTQDVEATSDTDEQA